MSIKTRRLKRKALKEVNAIRLNHGRPTLSELPKGIPGDSRHCPIANALNSEWGVTVGHGISLTNPSTRKTTYILAHKDITNFIDKFDSDKIPELSLFRE